MNKKRVIGFALVTATVAALVLGFLAAQRTEAPPTASTEGDEKPHSPAGATADGQAVFADPSDFLVLLDGRTTPVFEALKRIETQWHPGSRVMLLETWPLTRNPVTAQRIVNLLRRKTGYDERHDLGDFYRRIWRDPYEPHPEYISFKAELYSRIDPRFREYFAPDPAATIRVDEIRWGGVLRDGIPPLKNPHTLSVEAAAYLADSDIVFGVQINSESRAYPKRILAWHEMVKDVVGGESINGVYCTLCGSMIVYRTNTADGTHYELGTSGFLYRSNKLMYDHDTKSLWSTLEGTPVVGPLVGKGITLEALYVVTTTWGKWKSEHPETRVLSLDTGHRRDYGEGVAYRDYFAHDDLMFDVPELDERLSNKDEVFIVRRRVGQDAERPLAISLDFLRRQPVYHDSLGEIDFVVLTDETGANRAYEAGTHPFLRRTEARGVLAADGGEWTVTEEALINSDRTQRLKRLPAHRAFWFGWYAAHPDTRLVH